MREIKKAPMKFTIAATALLIFQSIMVMAQPSISLKPYKPGSSIAQLHIDQLTQESPASVTVRDEKGIILFSDQSKAAEYNKLIDFSKIGNGLFYVDISYPGMAIRKVVSKDQDKLNVKEDSYFIHNSFSKLEGNDKKMLVRLNKNLNETVTVRITDSEGHVLHEKAGIKNNQYSTLLDLSKLNSGVYNMQLISENFSSTRSFQVR